MIPFFQLNYFQVGWLIIQVWGIFVASGIIAATFYMTHLAKKYVLSEEVLLDATIWVLVSAFFFARVFHVVFYNLDYYLQYPSEIVKFWHGGLSSTGGFFGALLALYLFIKFRHFEAKEFLPYFDIMAVSLWLGFGIGRLGCFMTHMHPGRLITATAGPRLGAVANFLAVQFPFGTRFDLGLLESLVDFALFAIFVLLFPKLIKKRWGLVALYSSLSYAVARFMLDFLRATDLPMSDVRYGYLTTAQWGMLVVIIGLTAAIIFGKVRRRQKQISP